MVVGMNQSFASDPASKIEMIAPSPGEPIIYDGSKVVFKFSGEIVSKNFKCEKFRFWMVGEDREGRKALFSTNYYSEDAGLINLGGKSGQVWTEKVGDAIECSTYLDKGAYIGFTKYKKDWAKLYLERHNLPSDETSVATFVNGWEYLQEKPIGISRITFDSLGLTTDLGVNAPILQPVSFKAYSGKNQNSGKLLFKNLKVTGSQMCGVEPGYVCVSGKILWQSAEGELPVPNVLQLCGFTKEGRSFTCDLMGISKSDNQGNFIFLIRKLFESDDGWKKVNGKWEQQFSIYVEWGGMKVISELSFIETDQSVINEINASRLKSVTQTTQKVAEVKDGSTCQTIGVRTRVSQSNFTCTKSGSKKVWKKTGYWQRVCNKKAYPNPNRCAGRLADCLNQDIREFLYITECTEILFRI